MKIIFATDVAETSVTIDGVRHVVDSGIKKDIVFDPRRNVTSLQVLKISRSSAIQRTGRAGRTSTGVCYRLYTENEFDVMSEGDVPELKRVPLANTILNLIKMDLDARTFDWLDKPDPAALAFAIEDLVYFDAIESIENDIHLLTPLGELIIQTQLQPGLAKMITEGCREGFGEAAVRLAAICQMNDSFYWRVSASNSQLRDESRRVQLENASPKGDLVTMYRLFAKFENMLRNRIVPSEWNQIETSNEFDVSSMIDFDSVRISFELKQLNEGNDDDNESMVSVSTARVSSVASSQTDLGSVQDFDEDELDLIDATKEESKQIMEEHEEEMEQKSADEFLRKNKKAIGAWTRKNFLSQKTLSMIRSNIRACIKTLEQTSFWSSTQNEPTDEQLTFIAFTGKDLN